MDIDLTDDTSSSTVELGGQVWNIVRPRELLGASGLTFSKIASDILGDGKCKQKFATSGKAAFKHPRWSASRTIPKLDGHSIRKFYLKAFAIDDQFRENFSKFRQWSAKRRGGRKCIAEPDRAQHSISFSSVSGRYERLISSCWFPSMDARNINLIYYDDWSCSLKIEWETGRTLYAQFRPSHYKSFCYVLGLQQKAADKVSIVLGENASRSNNHKDLSSWARRVMKKNLFRKVGQ